MNTDVAAGVGAPSLDNFQAQLQELGEAYTPEKATETLREKLKYLNHQRFFKVWHDHSTIGGHSHLMILISPIYDPAFYTAGTPVVDVLRFFHGDKPAQQFEAGHKIGGKYSCVGCGALTSRFDDFAYCHHAPRQTFAERQEFVLQGQALLHQASLLHWKVPLHQRLLLHQAVLLNKGLLLNKGILMNHTYYPPFLTTLTHAIPT